VNVTHRLRLQHAHVPGLRCLQYNTDLKQLSANVRFDLIHRPLSDLFVSTTNSS